ncbi:SDR family NAD(P)-dependent oxidoreductase [Streptomyces triticirhizae]|uniref:SDR family oxidoreductase n=1 Tax=Streptomyces triticirhizae TaxID=2483353 RepID=A0A3M2LR94_9ACTN|nr:SDR family oxidoreductase [Streptomyces triticirhizae]RMI39991.1 SDR family oxidoreductase [Streptomyces triticirhizae]
MTQTQARGPLAGKGAVVTGGSRGIGRAIVERLAADGATVVFSYARAEDAARDVAEAVAERGGTAHPVRADFADPEAPRRLMERADQLLDGLDVLVNNATGPLAPTPLTEITEEDLDQALNITVRAAFLTIRHAADHMRDGGRIISVSTLNTRRQAPGLALYTAAKGALEQLTTVAALELGVRGITANTVSPGATDTELLRGSNPPEVLERIPALTPLRRVGQPADVAAVVALLTSPDAGWITGQNIPATGGLS